MEIVIANLQKKIPLNSKILTTIIKTILRSEGLSKVAIGLTFVTPKVIRGYNRKYLGHDYVTDVLSFNFNEVKKPYRSNILTGDVIICPQVALENSKLFESSVEKEIVLYIVHGVLHLLGYDDHRKRDIVKMRAKESQILSFLEKRYSFDAITRF